MGQILIRNLDDAVIQRLKTKAELAGKSLEQSLREMLTEHAPLTPEERVRVSRRMRASHGRIFPEITKEEIREGLEGAD
jgi:plasmid stability protein